MGVRPVEVTMCLATGAIDLQTYFQELIERKGSVWLNAFGKRFNGDGFPIRKPTSAHLVVSELTEVSAVSRSFGALYTY